MTESFERSPAAADGRLDAVGMRVRTEVMGAEYVAHSMETLTEFRRPLMELVTAYGWGRVWPRPELARPVRSLITIAAMAATGHQGELRAHVHGALGLGVRPEEIREVLLHIAVYCGAATAAEAFATVEDELVRAGAKLGGTEAGASGAATERAGAAAAAAATTGSAINGSAINTKINLLFASRSGEPDAELASALRAEAERIAASLPEGFGARAGVGLSAEEVRPALQALGGDGRSDFGAPGYQGLLWVVGPGGTMAELTEVVRGVAGRLGELIDATHSAAVAGTEEIFLPGDGPMAGFYAVRRRPGDSYAQFHDFWRLEHTKLSMYIPGFRYRQLHAVQYASRAAAQSAGVGVFDIDGNIEYFMDDIGYQIEMTRLENFPEIYLDEKSFIDHDRSTFSYMRFVD